MTVQNLLTPQEFKQGREKLGLTVAQLGSILNNDPRTVRRWEANPDKKTSRPPSPNACRQLEWLLGGFRPPQWPGKQRT